MSYTTTSILLKSYIMELISAEKLCAISCAAWRTNDNQLVKNNKTNKPTNTQLIRKYINFPGSENYQIEKFELTIIDLKNGKEYLEKIKSTYLINVLKSNKINRIFEKLINLINKNEINLSGKNIELFSFIPKIAVINTQSEEYLTKIQQTTSKSQYVGTYGEEISLTFKIIDIKENQFRKNTLNYIGVDQNNNLIEFSTKQKFDLNSFKIKGYIKDRYKSKIYNMCITKLNSIRRIK